MPPGEEVAEAYLGRILERCRESNGKIFVVYFGGPIGGFACVLTRVKAAEPDANPTEYGFGIAFDSAGGIQRPRIWP